MIWSWSHRADPFARDIADRHYNRQKPGTPQFVPPGSCCVLKALTETGRAFWVTSAPYAEYVRHRWPGAWVCSAFRNESAGKATDMIRDALAASVYHYGWPPREGMVTFVDRRKVRPTIVRGRETWGWTWLKAGFEPAGETKAGLLAFHIPPEAMPAGETALDTSA